MTQRYDSWWRWVLLAIVTAALAIPPEVFSAAARQQQGPIRPPAGQSQQQQQPKQHRGQQQPQYSLTVQTQAVEVNAVVTDQDGNIITGLKKGNFRIFDNGQPQVITNFTPSDAPITMVILLEFSNVFGMWETYWVREFDYGFVSHLGPKDWVALVTFDLKPHILVDFTHNKGAVENAMLGLYFPGFSESNLFDALIFTLNRLKDVQGKKSILVMATGLDTFSKHTLDQTYNALKQTNVTVFCIGVAENYMMRADTMGAIPMSAEVTYLQAKNEMNSFAKLTGGYAWFPRLEGEMPDIFNSVVAMLRNQYSLGFVPANATRNGKYHKIKVEVVDSQGQPLMVAEKKGKKKKKVVVYAREGYIPPKGDAGN